MIIGIGLDVVEHTSTIELNWDADLSTLHILSQKEWELYQPKKSVEFISGRFAAKEAVLKCLGTGLQDGISLKEIQILQLEDGKPVVIVEGRVKEISDEIGIRRWHVSITHSSDCSFAMVIAEG